MQEAHRAILIHSPHAGRSALLSQALTRLEQAGVNVASVLSIATLDPLPPQGAVWKDQGMTLAIAAGGDGVIGGVITHLATSGLPLGILPLGTSNDIARSLRIPQDLSQAVEVIAEGHTQPLDVGVAQPTTQSSKQAHQELNHASKVSQQQACFAHALTVGLNVAFARIATNVATRQRFGHLAYPVAALEAVRAYSALEVALQFDGLCFPPVQQSRFRPSQASSAPIDAAPALRCHALQVTIVNTPIFGGRWQFAIPAASFTDHLLDVVVIEEQEPEELNTRLAHFFHLEHPSSEPFAGALRLSPTSHPAELTGFPGIHHFQARGVTITTSTDPHGVTVDGEVRGQTPIQVQIAPEPVQVVVPRR